MQWFLFRVSGTCLQVMCHKFLLRADFFCNTPPKYCNAPAHYENKAHYKKKQVPVQGLFVPFARVGSGDPVTSQQIHWIELKHLLLRLCTTCRYRI